MVREKRINVKRIPPIDLDLDQPDQKRLWDHYQQLSKSGTAANWIRAALVAALPSPADDDAMTDAVDSGEFKIYVSQQEAAIYKKVLNSLDVSRDDDLHYVPPEDIA